MKHLRRLNRYFIKYKWHLLSGIAFVLASNYFKIKIPQTIKVALNDLFDKVQRVKDGELDGSYADLLAPDVTKYALYVIGFAILMGICMYFMRQTIVVMSRLIEYDMRKHIYAHYQKLHTAFYKTNRTGDLMSRITEDVSKVRMYLGPALLYGINLTGLVILVVYAMLQVSPILTFYTLMPLPFLSISIYFVSRIISRKSEVIQRKLADLTTHAQEVYSGIRIVKSYGVETRFQEQFSEESEVFKNKSMELARVNALFFPLMILIISLSTLLTVYISGKMVEAGEITPGVIAEFIIYVNYLTWPFTSVGWIASLIQQAEASQKRINEFLDTQPEIVNNGSIKQVIKGDIQFKNVTFHYPDTGVKALDNVSFHLKPGQKLAIMGKTASGKTTICEVLTRMYDIDSGEILIDGIPIADWDINYLRNQISYVPQDVFLFSDSVRNNITFGVNDASQEQVEAMAEAACVHNDILGFSNGYQTLVGERGVTLSGGQKQRVSIARALIKDPEVILLDDCLSAVDTKTEKQILGYLNNNLAGKTALIITHRILHYIDFDQIIVLDDGKIVEKGVHEDLLKNNGLYASIAENQSSLAEENEI